MTNKHVLYTDADSNIPHQICDRNGQVALSMCKVCRLVESELNDTPSCITQTVDDLKPSDDSVVINVFKSAESTGLKLKDMWCFDPSALSAFVQDLFDQYSAQMSKLDQPPAFDRYDWDHDQMCEDIEGYWVTYADAMAAWSGDIDIKPVDLIVTKNTSK